MSKVFTLPKSFKADVDRALHNLYQEKRTTLHPMTLIPIYYRRMFKGDTMEFGILESLLQSEPTFAPLMGNWRLRFEWYFDSDANRYGWVDNNTRLTAEEVMTRLHHAYITQKNVTYGSDIYDDIRIGRGSIADYAGVAPTFSFVVNEDDDNPNYNRSLGDFGSVYNIDFHLTYLNIVRNYHVNKQFPYIAYTNISWQDDSNFTDGFASYSLSDLDKLFVFLRSCPNGLTFDPYNDDCNAPGEFATYYSGVISAFNAWLTASENPYSGLFCSQYEPDLFQNLLAKDASLLRSNVSVTNGGFTIEQFRLKNHLQALYDKIFVSGGTDRDLSRTIWGIESNRDYDIPELLCVQSEIIGTNLITSTTSGSSDYHGETISNAPGSMSGNINSRRGKGRIQKFTAKTSGSLMCLVSLVPIVDYTQNIERHLLERNFMDEFTPDMARKGFEDVPLSDYCVIYDSQLAGGVPIDFVVGRQVAWLREMTATNRCHADFSNGGYREDWVLKRNFLVDSAQLGSTDYQFTSFTPYGNPLAYQYPFVSRSIDSHNFYLQVGFLNKASRPVPRRFMPNLGY